MELYSGVILGGVDSKHQIGKASNSQELPPPPPAWDGSTPMGCCNSSHSLDPGGQKESRRFSSCYRNPSGSSGVEVPVRNKSSRSELEVNHVGNTPWASGVKADVRNTSGPSGAKVCVTREVNDSLIELHRPSGIPSVQVLFFHGLPFEKSSRVHLRTWECGDETSNLWPQTWLVEEKQFPGAHVFVVRYNKLFDMKIVGENLLSDLIEGKIGQVGGCPVVLVGHSVGGLVIKQLCWEAHETLGLRINIFQVENFLSRIRGIFYYATPHHGIPDLAKARAKKADLLDSPLLKYFETLSTKAERLNSKFHRLCGLYPKWQIKGLAEHLPVRSGVFQGLVVVPEAAAREGEVNVDTADHFSITKPPSKISRRFNALAQLLQNAIDAKDDVCPRNFQYFPGKIIGIDTPLQEVKERLKTSTSLCLIGMGGSGKTTLAKEVFNEMAPKFEYTCFVSDVKLINGNEEGLKEEVWKRMYYNGKKVEREIDWSNLRERRLLLVLDDISEERDTDVLSEIRDRVASSESRFIATSRVQNLLDCTYKMPLLSYHYSQQLFVSRAFPNQVIPDNLASLVEHIVEKCEGLPLALEVLGQYLRTIQKEEHWNEALRALEKAENVTDLNEKLWAKLRLSYNGLVNEEKEIFLDATTFFSSPRWTLREAKLAWGEAYGGTAGLRWQTLVKRSLVYDVEDNHPIKMHEQLRSLGRRIASESKLKCRVWERQKALELLQSTNNSRKQTVHALRLERNLLVKYEEALQLARSNLLQLRNLRYLQLDVPFVISPREGLGPIGDLVLLSCVGLQLFYPARLSCLVILDLRHIDAEFLPDSIGQLSKLRILRLQYAPHLQCLPNSIGQLRELVTLELERCSRLETLPETLRDLSMLEKLILSRCSSLRTLPDSFGEPTALRHVRLWECKNLQTLPESFGRLSALTRLEIEKCNEFHSLPKSFGDLSKLHDLTFYYCRQLESLPDSFWNLPALRHLEFDRCGLDRLPEAFGKLVTLSHLTLSECPNIHSLPKSLGQLAKLQYLKISRVSKLERLPDSMAKLEGLRHLIIESTSLKRIPDYIRDLPSLETLKLGRLHYVEELTPTGELSVRPRTQSLSVNARSTARSLGLLATQRSSINARSTSRPSPTY